jgi:hypothetical protein
VLTVLSVDKHAILFWPKTRRKNRTKTPQIAAHNCAKLAIASATKSTGPIGDPDSTFWTTTRLLVREQIKLFRQKQSSLLFARTVLSVTRHNHLSSRL